VLHHSIVFNEGHSSKGNIACTAYPQDINAELLYVRTERHALRIIGLLSLCVLSQHQLLPLLFFNPSSQLGHVLRTLYKVLVASPHYWLPTRTTHHDFPQNFQALFRRTDKPSSDPKTILLAHQKNIFGEVCFSVLADFLGHVLPLADLTSTAAVMSLGLLEPVMHLDISITVFDWVRAFIVKRFSSFVVLGRLDGCTICIGFRQLL